MRTAGFVTIAVLAAALSGCASKDLFVVLPHEDGTVGSVVVHQNGNDTVLDKANAAVKAGDDKAFAIAGSDVNKRFAAVLGTLPPPARSFTLYFREGTAILEAESQPTMEAMYKDVAARSAGEIMVIGHTDTVGKVSDNDQLAYLRALTISDFLVENGIAKDKVISAGRGERELLVPTEDETREPRNRRVEISVR